MMTSLLGPAVEKRWRSMADAPKFSSDELLLAFVAFPSHPAQLSWTVALVAATEAALLERLASPCGEVEVGQLQANAAVAVLRALAHPQRAAERQPKDQEVLRSALLPVVRHLAALAQEQQLPARGAVRALQALKALQLQPPAPLVASLAETAASLAPEEVLAAMRLLTPRSVRDSGSAASLAGLATRIMAQLKSSRQAWELEALCRNLGVDLGEVRVDDDLLLEEQDEKPERKERAASGPRQAGRR
ncbi:unnamed protein product [Polarella glacialis]|uniref:Uncharacterized protein n=1 Tax=Polarella glacialis TaxID=89957 RepID=A0A813JN90_POLGL|nr:unnamed protein product [Polarella glacialis]